MTPEIPAAEIPQDQSVPAPPEPMDETELLAVVRAEIDDAANYIDDEIAPARIAATEYYLARHFGDEREGRSQVISQDVRDTVQAILPSLMRIFFGSEQVVEYVPKQDSDAPMAAQATDYAQYIISAENPGFLVFWEWFKDALIRKTGIIKWWADETTEVSTETYVGITTDQVVFLVSQPDTQVMQHSQYPAGDRQIAPIDLNDLVITRKRKAATIRIACLPPEEFIISRDAKNIRDARLVCHRTEKTASDLIAMGIDRETVEAAPTGSEMGVNRERIARSPHEAMWGDIAASEAMRKIDYWEAFTRVDFDGDGIAELRRVCLLGSGHTLVANEPVDEAPFGLLCPDPEPHVIIGTSVAEVVMDIQKIKSQIQRLMLDSLAQSIVPRTGIVENQVNMDDVLNDEIGGIIRMRAPGMVQPFTTPFVGQQAFPMLDYMDAVREQRTGITKASQGLAADVLQSTTKAAVAATVQAAQEKIECVARIFAETGVKDLFKGILRLMTTHPQPAKMVRLRGTYVNVQPGDYDGLMDVSVNVGLGGGTKEDKLATLAQIAEKQEGILQQAGPTNPIVTPAQYSYTLRKMAELAGFRESTKFFTAVPDNYQPPPQQPPAPPPQQQAALILAQAQEKQIAADIQTKSAELDLKRQDMMMTDMRERYKIETDEKVKLAEIEAKYGADVRKTQLSIDLENAKIQGKIPAPAPPPAPVEAKRYTHTVTNDLGHRMGSSDGGQSWEEVTGPARRYTHSAVNDVGHHIGSHDGGQTWEDVQTGRALKNAAVA